MKKIILSLLVVFSCLTIPSHSIYANSKPKVLVTTTFIADIVKNIAPEIFDIDLLMPAGTDPHLYQAKAQDVNKIQEADLVLYHGLHFEGKIIDILEPSGQAITKNISSDKLIQMLEDNEEVVDPHFWFDIDLYKEAVQTSSDILIEAFPQEQERIKEQTVSYLEELEQLQLWVNQQLESLPVEKRKLVTPHDAFNYFARSHQFEVYAPQGVNTNSEVSNNQLAATVDFIVDNQVPAIFVESTTNPDRMKKLQEGVEAKGHMVKVVNDEESALFSDSLAPQGQNGDNYISMYKHNVSIIVENLK